MKIEQKQWMGIDGWKDVGLQNVGQGAQLVLAFGGREQVKDPAVYKQLSAWYPKAEIILGSSAGEIIGTQVSDNTVVVTAISFKETKIKVVKAEINNAEESYDVGLKLAKEISSDGLVHVMVISEGLKNNGTKFIAGMQEVLSKDVSVTGGLVGDGSNFKETAVGLNGPAKSGGIVLIGFYGSALKIGYGSLGGWNPFGIERIITKSQNNVLYELDGKPALALYKDYLGEKAKDLPGSGLLFPLSLKIKTPSGAEVSVVRTILAVDEDTQSLTFAGDMPEGSLTQLMKADFDRLVNGASGAASMSIENFVGDKVELAILVSCIGRKLVLKDRTEEELEEVQNIIGKQAIMTGFYSYGEICPVVSSEKQCQLHNQTMTVTVFKEI